MSIEHAVAAGRRAAERLMTTTVQVTSPGALVWDPDLLDYVEGPPVVHYTGKARIRLRGATVRDVEAAGQLAAVQELILSLPFTGTDTVTTGRTVTVTANPSDPALVGRSFTIQGTAAQTDATARRFTIEGTS
ncbi:DUF6093 family protein [Agromyces bauzanensis]